MVVIARPSVPLRSTLGCTLVACSAGFETNKKSHTLGLY